MNSAEASWLHTLYITYAETLYRIACYRLQDANRAQDLLHSVFPVSYTHLTLPTIA